MPLSDSLLPGSQQHITVTEDETHIEFPSQTLHHQPQNPQHWDGTIHLRSSGHLALMLFPSPIPNGPPVTWPPGLHSFTEDDPSLSLVEEHPPETTT